MSFKDCIEGQIIGADKKGTLTEAQARKVVAEYDKLIENFEKSMGDPVAATRAADHFIKGFQARLIDENKAAVRHALMQKSIKKTFDGDLKNRRAAWENLNSAQKAIAPKPSMAQVVRDYYEDIYTRMHSISRMHMRKLTDFYDKHGSKVLGFVQDMDELPNIIRAVTGEAVENADSMKFGKAIREIFDELHLQYRNAGGVIGKIPNYFPQTHNAVKLKKVSAQEWIDFTLPRLNRENMLDLDTGLPMDDKKLLQQMKEDYEGIKTFGVSKLAQQVEKGTIRPAFGGGDVFKRRQQSRFYQFRDANAFLEYNDAFGTGDAGLFTAITQHIELMARDIALMQKLGPKSHAITKYADSLMGADGVGTNSRNLTNGMYNVISGRLASDGVLPVMYRFNEGARALQRFLLGGAGISALVDSTFVRMSLKMSGFDGTKALGSYLRGLDFKDPRTRRGMQRYTTIMQGSLGNSLEAARRLDSEGANGGKIVQHLNFASSAIIRAGGLTAITDHGRMITMGSIMGEFAEFAVSKQAYKSLDPKLRESLDHFGIGAKEYGILARANPWEDPDTGGTFLRAEDILAVKGVPVKTLQDIAVAYEDLIGRVSEMAVNEPTALTRSVTTGAFMSPNDARTGTVLRAFVGSVMTFKSFPITVTNNFVLPLLRNALSGNKSDIMDFATTIGLGVALGAVVVQTKAMLRGEEPRNMEDPKFWMSALMQSGGLGLFGDFLFDDYSRFGKSMAEQMMGPVVGAYADTFKAFNGNYNRFLQEGQESRFMRDMFDISKRYLPGGTLPYARLPIERTLFEGIERVINPDFNSQAYAKEQRMRTQQDRGYWWAPGDVLPEG